MCKSLSAVACKFLLFILSVLSLTPGLPLTFRQCALICLISGARHGFHGRGGFMGVYGVSGKPGRPGALLKTSQAVKTLRRLTRNPPASLALSFLLDLPHDEGGSTFLSINVSN